MTSQESPFVGCRIRIISKAQIRYEGYLHSVDTDTPNDPVITLSKVWSFGTEDRSTERPVGPRNEVYEQIVFRGRDLEDVRVIQSSVFLNDDPSIVSAGPGSRSVTAPKPREDGDSSDPWINSHPFDGVRRPEPIMPICRQSVIENQPKKSFPNFMSPRLSESQDENGIPFGLTKHDSMKSEVSDTHNITNTNIKDRDNHTFSDTSFEEHEKNRKNTRGRESHPQNRGFKPAYSTQKQRQDSSNLFNQDRGEMRHRRGVQRPFYSRGNDRTNQYRHNLDNPYTEKPVFVGDYDLEKANAELAEELEKIDISNSSIHGSTSVASEIASEDQSCYDIKKSFFDTISSEMMDRSQGLLNRRSHFDDRRLNLDTFGTSSAYVGNNYRRGNRYPFNYQNVRNYSYPRRSRNYWSGERPRLRQPVMNYESDQNII